MNEILVTDDLDALVQAVTTAGIWDVEKVFEALVRQGASGMPFDEYAVFVNAAIQSKRHFQEVIAHRLDERFDDARLALKRWVMEWPDNVTVAMEDIPFPRILLWAFTHEDYWVITDEIGAVLRTNFGNLYDLSKFTRSRMLGRELPYGVHDSYKELLTKAFALGSLAEIGELSLNLYRMIARDLHPLNILAAARVLDAGEKIDQALLNTPIDIRGRRTIIVDQLCRIVGEIDDRRKPLSLIFDESRGLVMYNSVEGIDPLKLLLWLATQPQPHEVMGTLAQVLSDRFDSNDPITANLLTKMFPPM